MVRFGIHKNGGEIKRLEYYYAITKRLTKKLNVENRCLISIGL